MGGVYNLLAGATGLVLFLIFGFMLFPATPQLAQAEEGNSKASLTINPVIGLSMQDTITVDVTPTQDGTFSSSTASLSVSTNNETGYSLYLSTANGENTLTSQNPAISDIVSAVDGGDSGVTSTNFTNNTWGYNLSQETASDTTTYKAVPTTANDAIIATESPTDVDTYNLTIGTKISTSLPSGTYSNQVVVSVVANPAYIPTISSVKNMQDVTSEICAASVNGETTVLMDIRDGSSYTIAKIDGSCWMVQNLRLSGGRLLTPSDSNVTRDWSFPNTQLEGNSPTYTEPQMTISNNTSYGGYYNYCAASAGTVCNDFSVQDATQDICPAGWSLPTHNEQQSIAAHGSSAYSLIYSGNYYNGALGNTGLSGFWWSSTAGSSGGQYSLYYSGGTPDANGVDNKYNGYSVRCVHSS